MKIMKKIIALVFTLCILLNTVIAANAEKVITVRISVYEYVKDEYIIEPCNVEINQGENVIDLLKKLDNLDITYSGGYVSAINEFAEFAHGKYSGWIYEVNGENASISAASYYPKDSDSIEWKYITDKSTYEQAVNATISQTTADNFKDTITTAGKTQTANNNNKTTNSSVTGTVTNTIKTTKAKTKSPTVESVTQPVTVTVDQLISNSLSLIKQDPSNYTPLVLSLYSRAIPKSMKTGLIEEAQQKNLKVTDIERLIINLSAVGESVTDVKDINLCDAVYNDENLMSSGLNGVIFALLALPHSTLTDDEYYNEADLINLLLKNQKSDGGFSLTYDMSSDVDITALTLTALSAYKDQDKVSKAIDKAVLWLTEHQNSDGSFSSNNVSNTESTAQVLIAMCSLGINIKDSRFVKGNNAYNALLSFSNNNGFAHTKDGETDVTATEQALLALAAYNQSVNPYTVEIKTHLEEINFALIIIIAVSLILVCGVILLVFKKRSKSK